MDKTYHKMNKLLVFINKMYYLCSMYNKEIKLNDNELPAKINSETGEVTVIDTVSHKRNPDAVVFEPQAKFSKHYDKSWQYLYYRTSPLEYKVATFIAMKAKPFTNSLEPLNDDTSVRELAAYCDISTGKVKPTFDKLFDLGVFGKFEVVDESKNHTRYWILNPYLSVHSKAVDKGIMILFQNTELANAFRS